MSSSGMWERFREEVFPRHIEVLRSVVGTAVPVEVDWRSLGEDPKRDESFDYDLEMLARGMAGADTHNPFVDDASKPDPARLTSGIERISIRRVLRPEDCRLVVERGTLHVDFLWEGTGRFSAREVETLLLDREGELVREWVGEPERRLSPDLEEVRRNRLPALVRRAHSALGRQVPVRIDWASLAKAPDAASRIVTLLEKAADAFRSVVKTESAVGRESVRERARERFEDRKGLVESGIASVALRGGRAGDAPVCRLVDGVVELCVHQDAVFRRPPRADGTPACPIERYYLFPGVQARDIEKVLKDALDLEVGPVLRQVWEADLPKARAHLLERINGLIGKCGHLDLRDKVRLRRMLAENGMSLEIDWPSLLAVGGTSEKLEVLRRLEIGPYNCNCDFGDLFKDLMFALDQAFEQSESFPERLLARVRGFRYEQIDDPDAKELVPDGSILVLRQNLLQSGGTLGDYTEIATMLVTTVAAMGDATEPEEDTITSQTGKLLEALGAAGVEVRLDPDLLTLDRGGRRSVATRVLAPLAGAFTMLMERRDYAREIGKLLLEVKVAPVATVGEKGVSLQGATLIARCCPGRGAAGFLAGEDLIRALDASMALDVRARIAEIERENHDTWLRMLRERFDRDVPVEVDWEGFLAHPEQGGRMLDPLNVNNAGVMRVIYGLTRWMEEDVDFSRKAGKRLRGILVTCAPDMASHGLFLDGPVLVHRCCPDTSLRGFLTIDDIQMELAELFLGHEEE